MRTRAHMPHSQPRAEGSHRGLAQVYQQCISCISEDESSVRGSGVSQLNCLTKAARTPRFLTSTLHPHRHDGFPLQARGCRVAFPLWAVETNTPVPRVGKNSHPKASCGRTTQAGSCALAGVGGGGR